MGAAHQYGIKGFGVDHIHQSYLQESKEITFDADFCGSEL